MIAPKNGFHTPNNGLEGQVKELMFFKATTMFARYYAYIVAFNPHNNSVGWVWLSSFTDQVRLPAAKWPVQITKWWTWEWNAGLHDSKTLPRSLLGTWLPLKEVTKRQMEIAHWHCNDARNSLSRPSFNDTVLWWPSETSHFFFSYGRGCMNKWKSPRQRKDLSTLCSCTIWQPWKVWTSLDPSSREPTVGSMGD